MTGRRGGDTSVGVVLQMVQQNHDAAEAAHGRLRGDLRDVEADALKVKGRLEELDRLVTKLAQAQTDAKAAPIDIGNLVFDPKMVLAIVGLVVSILGGTWFINQPIVSRLDKFEERMSSQKDVIDGLTKAMEMRRLEIQNLGNNLQQFQQSQQQRKN